MKQWFKNLNVRLKILSIIGLSSFFFIIIGFMSYYLMNTSRVVTVLTRCERYHTNYIQLGKENFYQFMIFKNQQDLEKSIINITKAKNYVKDFGRIEVLLETVSKKEIAKRFMENLEPVNKDEDLAYLMVDRTHILLFLDIALIKDLIAQPGSMIEYYENLISILEKVKTSNKSEIDSIYLSFRIFRHSF